MHVFLISPIHSAYHNSSLLTSSQDQAICVLWSVNAVIIFPSFSKDRTSQPLYVLTVLRLVPADALHASAVLIKNKYMLADWADESSANLCLVQWQYKKCCLRLETFWWCLSFATDQGTSKNRRLFLNRAIVNWLISGLLKLALSIASWNSSKVVND